MRLINADALKEKKVYSQERHEKVVPVAEIDWMPTIDAAPRWVRCEERLPDKNTQCLVVDNKGRCAVGYYRYDAQAWDSPAFGWIEREYRLIEYGDDDLLHGVGPIVAWMPIEPPREEKHGN